MSQKIYDTWVKVSESGEKKAEGFQGEVVSLRRGEPDKDGYNRNNFRLRRITVGGRYGVTMRLEPHDDASQYVLVFLGRHQAEWLVDAIREAIRDFDAWKAKKDSASARQRERAKKRKAAGEM